MTREQIIDELACGLADELEDETPVGWQRRTARAAEREPELAEVYLSISFAEVLQRAFAFSRREVERAVYFRPPDDLAELRRAKDAHGIKAARQATAFALTADAEAQRVMSDPPGGRGAWYGLWPAGRRCALG